MTFLSLIQDLVPRFGENQSLVHISSVYRRQLPQQPCEPQLALLFPNAAHLELFSLVIINQSEDIYRASQMGKPMRHGKKWKASSLLTLPNEMGSKEKTETPQIT